MLKIHYKSTLFFGDKKEVTFSINPKSGYSVYSARSYSTSSHQVYAWVDENLNSSSNAPNVQCVYI